MPLPITDDHKGDQFTLTDVTSPLEPHDDPTLGLGAKYMDAGMAFVYQDASSTAAIGPPKRGCRRMNATKSGCAATW